MGECYYTVFKCGWGKDGDCLITWQTLIKEDFPSLRQIYTFFLCHFMYIRAKAIQTFGKN
jgi:hypothetical protein